ncbi:MAG: DUF1598 domain-containing protein [Thermoguttaceae bacterium]|nr:DUF1598 domain-containing protein [Thermoguttaceae bacterium]
MKQHNLPLVLATAEANPVRERRHWTVMCIARGMGVAFLCVVLALVTAPAALGQGFAYEGRSVGGIYTDAAGHLKNAQVDDIGELARVRAAALAPVAPGLAEAASLRKVSLKGLEAAIADALEAGGQLPDEVRYLAGLQQIHYVLVYPEHNDIVLVGPGEGWKVDARGNIVGVTTGRPVLLLDDLLVALRTARGAAQQAISCSIDPTGEGLQRLRAHVSKLRTIGNPEQTARGIEETLGPQQVSITGVPPTSHFARVMVAADYRMKRLAMGFEPAPVAGLPSFLSMVPASGRGMSNMLPRWWLEPKYDPILRDPEGLAWELRGARVVAMTEEDFLTNTGTKQQTGKASPAAERWAENMTARFDELAVAEPIFGQLRNCMELAVVSALIVKENLTEKAGFSMPLLTGAQGLKPDEFFAPKQVDTQASLMKRGRNWVISASGGVLMNSWAIADRIESDGTPATLRAAAAPATQNHWWWN